MSPEYPLRVSYEAIDAYWDYREFQDREKVRGAVRNRNWYLPFLTAAVFVGLVVWLSPFRGGPLIVLAILAAIATNLTYYATWYLCSLRFPPDNDPARRLTLETKGAYYAGDPDVRMAAFLENARAKERLRAEAEDAEGSQDGV